MEPLSDKQIRACFVNATRREVAQASLPDLDALRWDRLDYLGWRDARLPQSSYVVLERDDGPVAILLRASTPGVQLVKRRTLCAWCEDVTATDDVSLYVARRAGAAGRQGNTVGTLICTEFICSANVRRPPTYEEAGGDDAAVREQIVARRVAGLRERSAKFADEVLR